MQKLFEYAEKYIEESSRKDIALIKLCLCAIGIIIGVNIAPKHKKAVTAAAAGVFVLTYIPLMAKFFKIVFGCSKAEGAEE